MKNIFGSKEEKKTTRETFSFGLQFSSYRKERVIVLSVLAADVLNKFGPGLSIGWRGCNSADEAIIMATNLRQDINFQALFKKLGDELH